MHEYHKIDTIYKRDPATKHKTLLIGEFSNPAFEYLARNEWVFTEKVDGTNIRINIPPGMDPVFGGKTDAAQMPAKLVIRLQEIFNHQIAKLGEMFPSGACLYGEGYGAGIQKGGTYCQNQDFVLFDVWVPSEDGKGWWLERPNIEDIAQKLGIDVVPIIGTGTIDTMLNMARLGFKSVWGDFIAEGIVARPKTELMDRAGKRIITKIKHKDYTALKEKAVLV
jgi:hypothetical protein